jgi:Helix-hairpin-helix motif/LAGLIDADG-like domain/Intein splicing domain
VFELHADDIALLLARMWDGDGHISRSAQHASYDTASQVLAQQVQHLLLRLDIVSRCYERNRPYRGRLVRGYVITITGEGLSSFYAKVGKRLLHDEKRRRARVLARKHDGRMSRDVIPATVAATIRLARSDVYWDKVVSIEPVGVEDTYDLEIDGNHNFLANDFVVHNSHAASFALLTYVSSWLKRYEPACFTAALLNSQPMGFYAPAQLVRDAREHGIEVRPVDVTRSAQDCTLEGDAPALRLGFRMVKGLSKSAGEKIAAARAAAPFLSVEDCCRRARLTSRDAKVLAACGAFAPLSRHRRHAWWDAALDQGPAPLLAVEPVLEPTPELAAPSLAEIVVADYKTTSLSLNAHPLSLLREELRDRGCRQAADLGSARHGEVVRIAGLVINRQRPATASGILFMTLEDETGFANLIVRVKEQELFRAAILGSRLLSVRGRVERSNDVVHVLVLEAHDLSALIRDVETSSRDFH